MKILFIILLVSLCISQLLHAQQITGSKADTIKTEVKFRRLWFQERLFMLYVNSYRLMRLRQPLLGIGTWHMHHGAYRHSVDMSKTGKFAHYNFDKRSKQYHFRGENIIMGEQGAWSCFKSWQQSKGHNENMLDRSYFFIGVGFVRAFTIERVVTNGQTEKIKTKGKLYGTHVFR